MYLRYGDPSWDVADAFDPGPDPDERGDGQPPKRKPDGPSPAAARLPTVTLCGVRLHAITETQCIQHILDQLEAGRGGMLVTPNLDHLHRCTKNMSFKALVAEADLVVADGMPLVWASRLQGTPLPERVAGSNLITTLSGAAAGRGRSVYLLGGSAGTAEGAARVLVERYPNLKIAGTFYPPVGFDGDAAQMAEIVARLAAAKPDIVYVALGSPKQEKLIARLRQILPDAWWVGVGNSFSFLCGDVRRAPRWMQVSGLEWAHRLYQEPKRLFKRYVVVGLPFAFTMLGRAVFNGIPNRLLRRLRGDSGGPGFDVVPGRDHANSPDGHPGDVPPIVNSRIPDSNGVSKDGPGHAGAAVSGGALPADRSAFRSAGAAAPEPAASLSRLRALILLGGSVRPSPLSLVSGRSVLDLPVDENGTVLNHWIDGAAELAKAIGLDALPVRVMVNQNTPEPTSAAPKHYGAFRVERDASEFRGTGGVLRDLATDYGDDDLILVANAAQVLLDPLPTIVAAMARKPGGVAVISHEDGTPSGLMLVRCKALRAIADTGYVDMKEQALPQIALAHEVRVVRRRRPTGLPIRTVEDFVQALRLHHRRRQGKPFVADPLAEDWSPAFAIIEPGATVDATARVHDSVVLAHGVVEPGAVLVRSVVCPGGVLRRDTTAVDQFVGPEERGRRPNRGRGFEVSAVTAKSAAVPAAAASLPLA
jgi:N-acetylglucosaminyldiphosphoundecaprenol N-acetyl-beta-D-mannosaminyltransferase